VRHVIVQKNHPEQKNQGHKTTGSYAVSSSKMISPHPHAAHFAASANQEVSFGDWESPGTSKPMDKWNL
jgi:hypothetical protein